MSVQCPCASCKGRHFLTRRYVNNHIAIYGIFEENVTGTISERDERDEDDEHYFDQLDSQFSHGDDLDLLRQEEENDILMETAGQESDEIGNERFGENGEIWNETFGENDQDLPDDLELLDDTLLHLENEDQEEINNLVLPPVHHNSVVKWFMCLIFWWQARYNITDAAVSFMLYLINGLLTLIDVPLRNVIPHTLYQAKKSVQVGNNITICEPLVVCPSTECNHVHKFSESFQEINGQKTTKKCSGMFFQRECQETLLFTKGLSNNMTSLVPYKLYLYKPLAEWLKEMLQIEQFRKLLGKRFTRPPSTEMEDIWDGSLWQELSNGRDAFLKEKYNFAFMLFVDWVRPYKRSQYSIGTVYIAVLNLPRSERFLKKWMCLAGIIPGPTEPKQHMNTYLKPLVDDLIDLWHGIDIMIKDVVERVKVRAILLCLSGDTLVTNKGCNKCKISAEREKYEDGSLTGRMSYLSREFAFEARTKAEVIRQSEEYLSAVNKTTAKEIAKRNGVRYSELHRLPYFDPVVMCAVDPMHAILLGLVKKEVSLILSEGSEEDGTAPLINQVDMRKLKERMKAINVPSDCGRLPTSLFEKATLDGFTAQQWLLFAVVYARPCFFEILPEQHYKCLVVLCEIVEACAKYMISVEEVALLNGKIQKHHMLFGNLYGKWKVSINNHLALHLSETMMAFGPCHTFWCFASERLNGTLVGMPSSGRCIEKELFNRFSLQQQYAVGDIFQGLPQQSYQRLAESCAALLKLAGDNEENDDTEKYEHERHISRLRAESFLAQGGQEDNDSFEKQRSVEREESSFPFKDALLLPPQRNDKRMSQEMFAETYEHLEDIFEERLVHLSPIFSKYGRCIVNGMSLSSSMSRSDRSSFCKAYWAVNEVELPQPYFCKVEFFFTASAVIKSRDSNATRGKQVKLAYVKWFKPHGTRVSTERRTGLSRVQSSFYNRYNIISVYRLIQRVVPCNINGSVIMALLQA